MCLIIKEGPYIATSDIKVAKVTNILANKKYFQAPFTGFIYQKDVITPKVALRAQVKKLIYQGYHSYRASYVAGSYLKKGIFAIPKGSTYFKGNDGDLVSSSLVYKGLCYKGNKTKQEYIHKKALVFKYLFMKKVKRALSIKLISLFILLGLLSSCMSSVDRQYDRQKLFEEEFAGTYVGDWNFDMRNVQCAFLTKDDTTVNAEIKDSFLSYESVIVDFGYCTVFMQEYTKYLLSLRTDSVYKSEGWVYYWDGHYFRIKRN